MINKLPLTLGVVGSRAYEMQAWRSQGCSALEQAVWAPNADMPVQKPSGTSWLRRPLDAVAKMIRILRARLFGGRSQA
jgi:hypothetical protein